MSSLIADITRWHKIVARTAGVLSGMIVRRKLRPGIIEAMAKDLAVVVDEMNAKDRKPQ